MHRIYFSLLLIVISNCNFSSANNKQITFVYDYENILTPEQRSKFEELFSQHEIQTTNEIVLVTTDSYSPDTSILYYSVDFLRQHGVGKKNINNGVAIVFSKAHKQVRIATGYGTEKVLKDEIAKKIIDSLMVPEFKKGKLYDGLWIGSKAITDFLEKPENKITGN